MSQEIAQRLRRLEQALLDPAVRGNAAQVGALLSENFREFGSSGRVLRKGKILGEILGELASEPPGPIAITAFRAEALGAEVYLLTYVSQRELADGQVRVALRSSVWRLEGAQWRMVFHQGTPVSPV